MYVVNIRKLLRATFYILTGLLAAVAIHKSFMSVSGYYGKGSYFLQNSRGVVKRTELGLSRSSYQQHLKTAQKANLGLRHHLFAANEIKQHCKPKQNIVFLKVHKCGSSTVQNILFRLGEKHELDFVMPPKGNYLGNLANTTFNKKYMIELSVDKYNILCHHTRFNESNIAEIMAPDSIYVTILREPVSMFESIFTYSHYDYVYGIKGSSPIKRLVKFLKNPSFFYNQDSAEAYIGHGKNPMLYDFGLENKDKDDKARIGELITQIDRRFELVMMADYFHESMILLKDLMYWSLEDIAFFPLNSRTNVTVPSSITQPMRKKIREWNSGDVKLYNFFNKTFWKKVEAYGVERMKKDVRLLKEYNEYLFKLCVDEIDDNATNVWHPHGVYVNTFKVKPEMKDDFLCKSMANSELLYTARLRTMLMRRYDLIKDTPGPPPQVPIVKGLLDAAVEKLRTGFGWHNASKSHR